MKKSRRLIFAGIIVIALGVTVSTTLNESVKSLGVVLLAVGGLIFITGMAEKRKEDERKKD